MVVDLLEKNRVNIKDLILPEVGKYERFNFDPKRDLTPSDWGWMLSYFDEARKESKFRIPESFLYIASDIAVIDPEKHPEKLITEEEWGAIKNSIEGSRGLEDWKAFASRAAALKLLDSSHFSQIRIATKDYLAVDWAVREAWSKLDETLHHDVSFMGFARDFKILAPDSPLPDEGDKVWAKMLERLEYHEEHRDWNITSGILANMRILFPRNFSTLQLKRETINEIKESFATFYHENRNDVTKYGFIRWVLEQKILSAKDVRVTDQGLEITMPDVVIDEKPGLPGIRKF